MPNECETAVIGNDVMDELKNTIGKRVMIEYTMGGKVRKEEGGLVDVDEFNHVFIDGVGIPFIGHTSAIKSISVPKKSIYKNAMIPDDFKALAEEERARYVERSFGKAIARRQRKK